jgi:hypothetical protein
MVSGFADAAARTRAIAENAEVLRDIAARGVDISGSRMVDFEHIFRDEESARAFADAATREGYAVEMTANADEEFPWDARASQVMAPTAESITTAELALNYLATLYGGRSDGWGFISPNHIPSQSHQP